MELLISARDLKKNFGKVEALKGVSLDVAEGEKVVVIGPSGSGKSVLIRSINGLERPDSGELTVNGIDMMAKKVDTRKLASEVAMVFQGYNLYPHKTVLENVTFAPIKVLKVPKAEAEEAGRAYLERVGLSSKLDKYPDQLSVCIYFPEVNSQRHLSKFRTHAEDRRNPHPEHRTRSTDRDRARDACNISGTDRCRQCRTDSLKWSQRTI